MTDADGIQVVVDARPQPFTLNPRQTALIVVDMQNDFGAEGGMFARAGIPIDGIQAVVAPTARVLAAARAAALPVVYLKMEFDSDLTDLGGPDAPNRQRHLALAVGTPVAAPDGSASRILVRDTWNTDILPALAPQAGDIIVSKQRFSGFFQTDLDERLRERDITTLIFTGCTTSVCVEATLRDAFYRDYRCLLLADCAAEPIGCDLPRSNHDASLFVIEALFGWVSDSDTLLAALGTVTAAADAGAA